MAAIAARTLPRPSNYAKIIALLAAAIVLAWVVSVLAELSGTAAQFHHHALYESGRPFWLSALIMLCAWQLMTAAMMLPSSLGFIRMYVATAGNAPDFGWALGLFLAAYFAVWTAFALAAFEGDMQLHRLVDGWPWLAQHSNLILVATFTLAASYQLTPLKDACLRACRNPGLYLIRHYRRGARNGLRIGFGHASFCLGCCWALMLVMFAVGVAHLAWMGALAVIMLVEKGVTHGDRIVAPVGLALALLVATALFMPQAIPGL